MITLNQVSDEELLAEYRSRFSINGKQYICGSKDVINHLRGYYKEKDREYFIAMFLNSKNQVITTEVLAKGTIQAATVYVREVMKAVLDIGATAVVFSHNHPSGSKDPKPSREDIKLTGKLRDGLKCIDVTVHDHVIITSEGHYSFADNGMI